MALILRNGLRIGLGTMLLAALVMPAEGLGVKRSSAHATDSCACIPWKQAYSQEGAVCGQGYEYFFAFKRKPSPMEAAGAKKSLGQEFCTQFYTQLHGNECVNKNMGDDVGQWCYVSSQCKALNGGEVLPVNAGKQLSLKVCTKQDAALRSYSPWQLVRKAYDEHLEIGLLQKMSYPVYKKHLWKDVEASWGLDGAPMSQSLIADMKEIVDSGRPYVFDTAADGHPPHRIVVGKTVLANNFVPEFHKALANPTKYTKFFADPSNFCELSCETGCNLAAARQL